MSAADVEDSVSHWPCLPTLIRLALAVGCGVLVGLEREHHGKAGARTFGLAALLGCLGGLSRNGSAILSMVFLGVLVCFFELASANASSDTWSYDVDSASHRRLRRLFTLFFPIAKWIQLGI
jgi:MgtC family